MTTATDDMTTARLLLEWDKRRARSQQRDLGMSEVGGCQRRAGYRLAGVEPSNDGGSMRAVMGTAIHASVASAFTELQAAGLLPTGDMVETEVRFAGILGHLDRYRRHLKRVVDTKTCDSRRLGRIKLHGPDQQEVWQVSLYAAGLITRGVPVREVALDYIARDTGADYLWVAPFDPQQVRDAMAWLDMVRTSQVHELHRDYAPDSEHCKGCPFQLLCWGEPPPDRDPRVVLFHENPDAEYWARVLAEARAAKSEAEALEKEAKGALDAINPGTSDLVDVGMEQLLRWKRGSQTRLDGDMVRAEYKESGIRPPEKVTWSTRLEFVAREPTDVIVPVGDDGGV